MERGTPYTIALLTPFLEDLEIHFGAGGPATICNKLYQEYEGHDPECQECLKPGYQGKGLNRPMTVKAGIGFVFDLVDKTETSKNTGKEFTHNPLKVIEMSGGKNGVNFENIQEASLGEYLQYDPTSSDPSIWRLKLRTKEDGGGMTPPTLLASQEIKKLGKQLKLEVPQEILDRFAKMSEQEFRGLLLSAYGNCKIDYLESLGVIFPEKKESDSTASEESDELDD